MASPFRLFPPATPWCDPKTGIPTPLAEGFIRSFFDYIGARAGAIPTGSLGGDGVSTTTFLREDGSWAIPAYPVGANPSASIGTAATNGSAATFMRSDAAPALNLSISPTWTGTHSFNGGVITTSLSASTTIRSTGGFGCNGAAPQTSAALDAAIGGSAGAAYTAAEQSLINSLISQVNKLRAALVANGIGV